MSSDQKFTTLTADGQVKTASGGSTNIGPARVQVHLLDQLE